MASLLQETLYEIQCQAPAPSKDFHHFVITKKEIILRSWKISARTEHRKMLPWEIKKTHSEFLQMTTMHKPLEKIFGKATMEYVLNLCRGQFDFIVRIPDSLKIRILSFLDTQDIKQLSETCKTYQKDTVMGRKGGLCINSSPNVYDTHPLSCNNACYILYNSEEFWEKIKPMPEIHSSAVRRKGGSASVKISKLNTKTGCPVWMHRRRNTLF